MKNMNDHIIDTREKVGLGIAIAMALVILLVTIANASDYSPQAGEFSCDLVSYNEENYEDGSMAIYKMFYCHEDIAQYQPDSCYLWRVTISDREEQIAQGYIVYSYWYMCNEFQTFIPMVTK